MKRVPVSCVSRTRDRRGFVLIIVLVIVVMVSFAGFAFVNTMSDEYRAVHTNGDLLAAEQALASAELMVLKQLERPRDESLAESGAISRTQDGTAGSELSDNPRKFQQQLLVPEETADAADVDPLAWQFSVVAPNRAQTDAVDATERIRFGLEDESARLHLSTLMAIDAVSTEKSREILMGFPGMTEAAADSLLDWLDADDEPREFGAETEDYLDTPGAIHPRNGLPATLEELLLVRDVSRRALLGPDEDRNFVIDPRERRSLEQLDGPFGGLSMEGDGALQDLGWIDLLTLHSAERNDSSAGEPRIDLNDPDESRLRERLGRHFPENVVDFIIQYRRAGSVGGAEGTPSRIHSIADLVDATVQTTGDAQSRVIHSPITSSSRELLHDLLDRTTTDSRAVIPGRININVAPRPVLRAVAGLSDEHVTQILARRTALDEEQRKTSAWLLTEQIVTVEEFRQLLPHVTTGGDVHRAQIIAWRTAGGPYRRVEVVFDASTLPARRAAWRDLSAYGAVIPVETLAGRDAASTPGLPREIP